MKYVAGVFILFGLLFIAGCVPAAGYLTPKAAEGERVRVVYASPLARDAVGKTESGERKAEVGKAGVR